MKEQTWNPPTVRIQSRKDRPTVEELQKANSVNITDENGDVYKIEWNFDKTRLKVTGGMFGQIETEVKGWEFNNVMNIPEVLFALAGGEKYVNLLLGHISTAYKQAYVRVGVDKVEVENQTE